MKRTTALGAIGILALMAGLSACQAQPPSSSGEDGLVIGSVVYGTDGYQTAHTAMIEEYGESIGVTVRSCNSRVDVSVQQKCMFDLVAAGVDAIIMQPVDPAAATAMINQAEEAGVPVLTWAIGPVPEVDVPFVVLSERAQTAEAGAKAAQWVKDNLGESPRLVVLSVPKNTNCEAREQGFVEGAMSVDPETVVVASPNGGGARVESQNAMADIIQSGVTFNIVTGCNGESTIGGLLALKAAGRGEAVDKSPLTEYLFSIDGTSDEVNLLLDPTSPLMETLALAPRSNTKALLDAAIKLAKGEIDSSFQLELTDEFLTPDCDEANAVLREQYGTQVDCK